MTHFYVLLLALGIGVIAGLRSFTAPAVVAWAAPNDAGFAFETCGRNRRIRHCRCCGGTGVPRTRGDEPTAPTLIASGRARSPHARG